ncbi:hypothetical protein ACOJCM_09910 [Billgrantia sp. LNSP4103-1]|uniref:hypothetical protein n=1 Tax=Billgrantia sp. LNSP4103-1 TaxID=3410266 RepID=UPI00403F269B
MKTTEILLQGEHIPDIQIVEIEAGKGVHDVLKAATKHRNCEVEGDFHVFPEDSDEPLAQDASLPEAEVGHPARLHVHRCRQIEVEVSFNGTTHEHKFGPGKTIETLKKWAALNGFGMAPGDAAEHVLQLSGTNDRPEPDTHIGTLVSCPNCKLNFDLVPLKRVEG